ncbi:MAG: LPD7 domain-containing protein, partial [Caldimonas sp.]
MVTAEYQDPRGEFAVALKSAGLIVDDGPVMDGHLHRVRVEGAKPGTRDGSYVGHLDGKPSGYIENFKTGHKENWSASDVQLTASERAESIAQMQRARAQRAAELSVQQSDTAERVGARWDRLSDVPPAGHNAYLIRKGVEAHGVKFDGERLVVPVRDVQGKLWSLQSIPPDKGAPKMFERGGRKAGNMHVIGEITPGTTVMVAEGYATGASLHQATGKTVAVAFDAGNLDAVVGAIKQRYPTSPVVIMGDDDIGQQPNVGYDKATAAGRKHGVGVAFPTFQEPGKLSDFNDLHMKEGLGAVRTQVESAVSRAAQDHQVPWPVPLAPALNRMAPHASAEAEIAAERPKGIKQIMAEPTIDVARTAAPASTLPGQSVGDPNGWLNQNAQADRDRGDRMGVTAQIEEAFAKGLTAGQARVELNAASKLDKVAVEEQTGFIVNVRATLGIPSRGTEEGQAEFAAWQAERLKRMAPSDPSSERAPRVAAGESAPSVVVVPSVTAEAPARGTDERLTSRDMAIGTAHVAQLAKVGGPAATTLVQAIVADAAKIASDLVQGKEVKALDVASAAASVAMTTGVGGPAVQLGAQTIAGVSAIDAGQRTLNTAEAKLKEPDPADVAGRKDIERRNDEMLTVPRNALDERTAREVVQQDVVALHRIDTPAERHAAAVAMGHNAQDRATYKTELARQDPYTAEVVALAFAQEQQKVAAKEDRKAPEISSVAPAVTAVDTTNRTAQRQEGVNTVERADPQQAVINTIERVAQREPDLDAAKRLRSEPPLEDRFNVVSRFGRGRDYHFRDQPGKVAFKERWLSMQTSVDTPAVVKAMLDRAQERGWETIRIKGSEEFQRQAWIAATARGIKAVGYEPTQGDRAAVNDERARLNRDEVKSPTQTLPPHPTRRPGTWRDPVHERAAAEPSVARRSPETASPKQPPAQATDKPIAGPLRSFLTERGVAAAEVDATVAVASERMQQSRVYVGQVVSHGPDHYEFDKKNAQSYH